MAIEKRSIIPQFSGSVPCSKNWRKAYPASQIIARLVGAGLLATSLIGFHARADDATLQSANLGHALSDVEIAGVPSATAASHTALASTPKRAGFAQESASEDVRHLADWVVDSEDSHQLPFLIIDKRNAKAFVFNAAGQIQGASPVLLGSAKGDDSVPGIGQRKLSTIRPDERTTPAGRFAANLDRNLLGEEILWVDYDAAISLHRVVTSNAKERRAERLASPATEDNRISYGCINVPNRFYEQVVSPVFKKANGIVYVLPETRSARDMFGSHAVDQKAQRSILPAPKPTARMSSQDNVIMLR
jgi:hypothetical protein